MIRVAAVDPGGRTGLVTLEVPSAASILSTNGASLVIKAMNEGRLGLENIDGTELDQTKALYYKLRDFNVVIIEDYIIRVPLKTTRREALSPVRIAFGLDLLLTMSSVFNGGIVYQQSTQLSVITDDRLKAWGLWLPGQRNKDIRAALKHLLIYLRAPHSV